MFYLGSTYDSTKSGTDTIVNAIIKNTSFVNNNSTGDILTLNFAAVKFVDCVFENNTGVSTIFALRSKILFEGNNVFRSNSGLYGAGVSLIQDSFLYFEPPTNILFEGNHADYVGGAIYTDSKSREPCFYHVMDSPRNDTIVIAFVGNTANFGGSSLYGDVNDENYLLCDNFSIFDTSNTETEPSAIASDPQRVCQCDEDKLQPNCPKFSFDTNVYHTSAFPGQVFPVRLAVVGEFVDGVVTGAVRPYLNSPINATVGPIQRSQSNDKPTCGNFNFSVNSTQPHAAAIIFKLAPELYFFEHVSSSDNSRFILSVSVELLDCPLGFSLSPATGSCVCDPRLDYSNIECNINNQSFLRPANSWIGFINESSAASNKTGVMFHPNCPIEYCSSRDVSVTSNTSDSQCEPHRTGLLCGKCEDGYSLTWVIKSARSAPTLTCSSYFHLQWQDCFL